MPGIVIGSIFVFILTMGEFATVRIIGGGTVSSVGTIVQTQVASVQFPQAAASAVFLVLAMVLGVFVLLRFSNLREELVARCAAGRWTKRILAVYFVLFLLFLYGPMIVMAALSFQGPQGTVTFPMRGLGLHWWDQLVNGARSDTIRETATGRSSSRS